MRCGGLCTTLPWKTNKLAWNGGRVGFFWEVLFFPAYPVLVDGSFKIFSLIPDCCLWPLYSKIAIARSLSEATEPFPFSGIQCHDPADEAPVTVAGRCHVQCCCVHYGIRCCVASNLCDTRLFFDQAFATLSTVYTIEDVSEYELYNSFMFQAWNRTAIRSLRGLHRSFSRRLSY